MTATAPLSTAEVAALQALCAEGLSHHQAGRLDAARACYEQVLAADPNHFDALHLLGVHAIQTGQLEVAVALIRRAIAVRDDMPNPLGNLANALNRLHRYEDAAVACDRAIALAPGFSEAHGNRGQALQQLGRLEEALASYAQVVALRPTPAAHFNVAVVLRELGRPEPALASYDAALALDPNYPEGLRGAAIVLRELGRLQEGLGRCERAIQARPDYAEAWHSRGVILRDLGNPSEALASLGQAIAHRPDYAEAHGARGNALSDLKQHDAALASYDRAVAMNPSYVEAISNKVVPLRALQRLDDALAAADQAITLKPDYAEAHNNRGGALYDLRRLDAALSSYDHAIALKPDYAEAAINRGVVLYELRRFDEAMASYDLALSLQPASVSATYNQALCRLMIGDFHAGWAQYESRWATEQVGAGWSTTTAPRWTGAQSLAGKRILVWAEQGLGDTLQFCRYASELAAQGAAVTLQVSPPLMRLLGRLGGVARVVASGADAGDHDLQAPMMSLPLALGGAPEVGREGYLTADPADVAAWARRLGQTDRRRVGLCWAGGHRPDNRTADSMDRRRSLPLEAFAVLGQVPGLDIYSLQMGPPAAQLDDVQAADWHGPQIIDLTAELRDLGDTAALVANLDLVIACDTAVAHLAGALGKPVWILNRHDACWRWLADRTDSPWYAAARLFRQPAPGDWSTVMQQVCDALKDLAPRE